MTLPSGRPVPTGESSAMVQTRKLGYCVTTGELIPGRAGIATPLFNELGRVRHFPKASL